MKKSKLVILLALICVIGLIVLVKLKSSDKGSDFDIAEFEEEQSFSDRDYVASKDWCIRCDNGRLLLTSLKTGESRLFCFDTTCNHKDGECISDLQSLDQPNSIFVHNKKLYIVDVKRDALGLYRQDVNNSVSEMYIRIPLDGISGLSSCVIEGDILYIIATYRDPEYKEYIAANNRVGSYKMKSKLYKVVLDTGEYQELKELGEGFDDCVSVSGIINDELIYSRYYYTIPEEKIYDLETFEPLVDNPKEYICDEIWKYSLEEREISKLDKRQLFVNSDSRYDYWLDAEKGKIIAYEDGNVAYEVDLEYFPNHENWAMYLHTRGWSFLYELLPDGEFIKIFDENGKKVQQIDFNELSISMLCEGGVLINTEGRYFKPDAIIPMDDFLKAMEDSDFSNIKSKAVRFKDVR